MKKRLSKNLVIGMFLGASLSVSVMFAYNHLGLKFDYNKILRSLQIAEKAEAAPQKMKALEKSRQGNVSPATLLKNDSALQGCYENLLARDATNQVERAMAQEGIVHVHMTIDPVGNVNNLKLIHSDFADLQFQDCVLQKIKATRVPATADRMGVVISHRFRFKKKQSDQLSFKTPE